MFEARTDVRSLLDKDVITEIDTFYIPFYPRKLRTQIIKKIKRWIRSF